MAINLLNLVKPITAATLTAALELVSASPSLSPQDVMLRIRNNEILPIQRAIQQSQNPLDLYRYQLVEYYDLDGIAEAPDISVVYPITHLRTTPAGEVQGVVDAIPSDCFKLDYQLPYDIKNRISCLSGERIE